jgi:hypothetical protein
MRTTLALADDVFLFARQRAQQDKMSLGDTISKYVRLGMQADMSLATMPKPKSKYSIFPKRDEVITSEHVYRLMGEEGI